MTKRPGSLLLCSVFFGLEIAVASAQSLGERPPTFDERWSLPPDQSKPELLCPSIPQTKATPKTDGRGSATKPSFVGKASFYAYAGGKTASGAQFRPHDL